MNIVLFEDEQVENFFPFLHLKPIQGLYCGTCTLLEKVARYLDQSFPITVHTRSYLSPLVEDSLGKPQTLPRKGQDTLFLSGRVLMDSKLAALIKQNAFKKHVAYVCKDQLVAFRQPFSTQFIDKDSGLLIAKKVLNTFSLEEIKVSLITFPWDILSHHSQVLTQELELYSGKKEGTIHRSAILVEEKNITLEPGAIIGPGAVLDASQGKIFIGRNTILQPGVVLFGNIFIEKEATIKAGAHLHSHIFIGSKSKVGGEINNAIIEPFANKQHDGFLGDSYLSQWCNIAAGTVTSNMKNNLSTVKMYANRRFRDSKKQFLGLFIGEHSKTSINTSFYSGTMMGVCSTILGADIPPTFIPSFQWGNSPYDLEKAIITIKSFMARRGISLNDAYKKAFLGAYKQSQKKS